MDSQWFWKFLIDLDSQRFWKFSIDLDSQLNGKFSTDLENSQLIWKNLNWMGNKSILLMISTQLDRLLIRKIHLNGQCPLISISNLDLLLKVWTSSIKYIFWTNTIITIQKRILQTTGSTKSTVYLDASHWSLIWTFYLKWFWIKVNILL